MQTADSITVKGGITFTPGSTGQDLLFIRDVHGFDVNVTRGGSVEGASGILVVKLNSNGTYDYEYTLNAHVDHIKADGNDTSLSDSFTVKVTNGGSQVPPDSTIDITIADDSPVNIQNKALSLAAEEESARSLFGLGPKIGNDELGDSQTSTATGGEPELKGVISWGADGFGSLTGVQIGDNPPLLISPGGSTTVYFNNKGEVIGNPTLLEKLGSAANLVVQSNGSYTLTVTAAMNNGVNDNGSDGKPIASQENWLELKGVTLVGIDGDGDKAFMDLVARVQDDVPVNIQQNRKDLTLELKAEEESATKKVAGVDTKIGNDETNDGYAATATGNQTQLEGVIKWGADKFGSLTGIQVGDQTPVGLDIQGNATIYFDKDGHITTGLPGANPAAANLVIVGSTGAYTLTVTGAMQHADGDGENWKPLDPVKLVGVDGDGDIIKVDLTTQVRDDVPEVNFQKVEVISEGFEGFEVQGAILGRTSGWTVVGEGGAEIVGKNGLVWTVNSAGIEIQAKLADGSVSASELNVHAELDANDNKRDGGTTLTTLSTQVNVQSSNLSMSLDYMPRPADPNDSGMKVTVAGVEVTVGRDSSGQITIEAPADVKATTSMTNSSGWTTITLNFKGMPIGAATVSIAGLDKNGTGDTLGAYVDNILMTATPTGLNAILEEESALKGVVKIGNDERNATDSVSGSQLEASTGVKVMTGVVNWGADGFGEVTGVQFGNTIVAVDASSGIGKVYFNSAGEAQTGSAGAAAELEVKGATGEYTLTVTGKMDHSFGNKEAVQGEDMLNLTTVKILGQDKDGDSIGVYLNAQVKDDIPVITTVDPTPVPGITVQLVGSDAGYNNTWGYYIKDADGKPTTGSVVWDNVKNQTVSSITLPSGVLPGQIGFFMIADGDSKNPGLTNDTPVTFKLVDGQYVAYSGTTPLAAHDAAPVLFDNINLNKDGLSHINTNSVGSTTGNQNWEDIVGGGDRDYNDVMLNVTMPLLVDDSYLNIDATSDVGKARFTVNYGADGADTLQAKAFELLLKGTPGNIDSGFDDTALASNGQAANVMLKMDGTSVIGVVKVNGVETKVFTLSLVNASTGEVELDQHRAVFHPTAGDANEVKSMLSGLIDLKLTAMDSDGDKVSASLDVGRMLFIADDGPVALNDTDTAGWVVNKTLATGNVLTGVDTTSGIAGKDQHEGMQDGAKAEVVQIRAGAEGANWTSGTTVTSGGSASVTGAHGKLTMESDGDYTYEGKTANVDLTATGTGVGAFNFGSAYSTHLGEKLEGNPDDTVTRQTDGLGVAGTQNGMPVPDQINHNSVTDKTEALSIDLGTMAVRAVVDVSHLYQDEVDGNKDRDGETGRWEAFDNNGNKVGEGQIGGTLLNLNGSSAHEGKAEIEVLGSDGKPIAFQKIVFTAEEYLGFDAPKNAAGMPTDSSDYFVKAVSFEEAVAPGTEDKFSYQMKDGDGDTDSANLTITTGRALSTTGLGTVQEDALLVGNLDSVGQSTSTSGTLGMGNDTVRYTLLAPVEKITSGGKDVTFTVSDDGLTMTGKAVDGRDIMTVNMNRTTGAYTVALTGQVDHQYAVEAVVGADGKVAGENENLYMQLVAQKSTLDGGTTTTEVQGFNVMIQDDAVKDVGGQQALVMAVENGLSGTASLGVDVGADVVGATVKIVAADVPGDAGSKNWVYGRYSTGEGSGLSTEQSILTADGYKLYYVNVDIKLVAQYDNASNIAVPVFEVTGAVDSITGMTSYTVRELTAADRLDRFVDVNTTTETVNFAAPSENNGGYDPIRTVTSGDYRMVVTADADQIITSPPDTSINSIFINAPDVNWSNQGIGVSNNFVDNAVDGVTKFDSPTQGSDGAGERLVVEFQEKSGNNNWVSTNVQSASFLLDQLGSDEVAKFTAIDGTTPELTGTIKGTGSGASDASDDQLGLTATGATSSTQGAQVNVTSTEPTDAGSPGFDKVEFTAAEGSSYRVLPTSVTVNTTTTTNVKFGQITLVGLSAIVTDGDGDTLTKKEITVVLDQQESSSGGCEGSSTTGVHTIEGTTGSDVIVGSSGADLIQAYAGNDVILAGGGDDTINAGAGNDTIIGGSNDGKDTIDGGADTETDTVSYAASSSAIEVTLNGSTQVTVSVDGSNNDDRIKNVENVEGGSGNDKITGDANDNVLTGNAGNDTLTGGAGNDILVGGAGADHIVGGTGIDTASYASDTKGVVLDLSLSSPTAQGGATGAESVGDKLSSIENVTGGSGHDTITGDANANVVVGGAGNDTLIGGDGKDTLEGGEGDDTLIGGKGGDTVTGGADIDVIQINLADVGTSTTPALDLVTDLTKSDTLQLADLLPDTATQDNLGSYLIESESGTSSTTLTVDTNPADPASGVVEVVTVADSTPAQLQEVLTFPAPALSDLVTVKTDNV